MNRVNRQQGKTLGNKWTEYTIVIVKQNKDRYLTKKFSKKTT